MSRQSMAPQRNLSLTEELERLEQSITLTLQEIDHNFSRAHRIVTTNILPIVEQYGKHSEAVWEGSKFWKTFFEASANVSLSSYEANNTEDVTVQEDTMHEDTTQQSHMYEDETAEGDDTVTGAMATPQRRPSSQADLDDTSDLESPTIAHAHSTPRAPNTGGKMPQFAEFSSPYENLRQEVLGSRTPKLEPTTPGRPQGLPDMMGQFESSPFVPPTSTKRAPIDEGPLMHHVLDKTYRVQATPLISPRKYKPTGALNFTPGSVRRAEPTPREKTSALPTWADDSSPMSSPAPQLRANIFSPAKTPRTPGVSVQTPGKGKQTFSVTKTGANIFDSDSEDEDDLGFSPPKTVQFHIPQSKLLQTPAREASRRIVDDLLLTAGGDITDSTGGMDEDSPSVVRRRVDLDDSF